MVCICIKDIAPHDHGDKAKSQTIANPAFLCIYMPLYRLKQLFLGQSLVAIAASGIVSYDDALPLPVRAFAFW